MTTDQLQELLFGKISDGNRIPGLIEKANGGTLFLDEFDKIADKSFYSELLRVLEAKEYVPVNGGEVLKFSNVNWVFAGAFTGQSPSCAASDLPVDFWSRLTARMTIENPFGFDGAAGHWSYAGGLFLYFFMREIVAFAEGASSLLDERKGDFRAHLARKIMGLHNTSSLEDSLIGGIAREFQARISSGRYDVYRLHSNQSVAFRSHHTRRVLASRGRSGRPDEWLSTMGRLYKLDNPPDRPTLDSARSVRQAAKAAFAELIRQLLANPELPLTPPTDRGENQGDGDAIGTALNRAVNAVYRGRPRVMEDRELLPPGLPLYPLP